MRDYLDLIMELRESASTNIAWEAADAIEALVAELHRAEFIIQEQARENQKLRIKGKREA